MAFARPTLSELIEQQSTELAARFPGADSSLRRSVLGVFARTWAGALHGMYGFLAWIADQLLPDTADAAVLERHASAWGLSRGAPAAAGGEIDITGIDGAVLPAGAILQRGQFDYATLAEVTIEDGEATVEIEALDPGAGGNLTPNTRLQFVSPTPGISGVARVGPDGLAGGADEETDEALRARLLERMAQQPQGGAAHDYLRWAKESSTEITRVWVKPSWSGPGTVGVTFVMDGRDDIIPLEADLDALAEYLEARRPVTAEVVVFAPTPKPLDPTIDATPDIAAVRAAITAALESLLAREAEPGATVLLSHIREAVSGAAGEVDSTLTSPAANFETEPHELAVLGDITWI